jgi:hypothetical protein
MIQKLRGKITENRLKVINQVAGVALLAFGGVLFIQFALGLLGHAADTMTTPGLLPEFLGRRLGLLGDAV